MDSDMEVRARIPADVEKPDRIVLGLTARQVAILASVAAVFYLLFKVVGTRLPLLVRAAVVIPVAAIAVTVALGRRDGLSLDAWLLAALRFRRSPRRLVPAPEAIPATPAWAPSSEVPEVLWPLRLPATAISADGVIDLGTGAAVMVAATTVNVGLRTDAEQAALVGGYARWLNSLTGPVQVVVSSRRVDLTSHAARIADASQTLPHPALAEAALDYADFLYDIGMRRDPLWRTVTIVCSGGGGGARAGADATRLAEHSASALAALGCQTRVLDGPTALAVLTSAVDPYQPGDASWPRANVNNPVAGPFYYIDEEPPS